MKFVYKTKPEHLGYINKQITEVHDDLETYSAISEFEYEGYKNFLPNQPKRIMDLGCGLGRVAIYLNAVLQNPDIHYILADTTLDNGHRGLWDAPNGEFYNDLALTKSFVQLNGMTNFETFDVLHEDWDKLRDIDLIISCCSVGTHVPIERTLSNLLKVASNDCTMIFGIRNWNIFSGDKNEMASNYSQNSFREWFQETYYVSIPHLPPMPQEDWLILKNKQPVLPCPLC